MNERRLEALVIGPGKPGELKVELRSEQRFVVDVPIERLQPALRVPNSQFVAVVTGRELIRVETAGRSWLTIQDRIRSVLNTDWDPIRVDGVVDDEYDGYIGHVYALLERKASDQAISEYLLSVETDWMGLQGTPMSRLIRVAAKLRALQLPRLAPD